MTIVADQIIPAIAITRTPTASMATRRGKWGELIIHRTDGANRSKRLRALVAIQDVIADLERGDVDEHRAPAWETGCEFDSRGRGEAVNVDIYGLDLVDGQALGIVQVRQCRKHPRRFTRVRKNYFLVGRNEGTGQPFAHPIESRVVHAAVARDGSPESAVIAARAWIFQVSPDKLDRVLRHGDVALVPVARVPVGDRVVVSDAPAGVQVIDAHVLMATEIITVSGRTYARDPLLQHLKGQHADVRGDGWYRVQVGVRADTWSFSRPTAD